MEIDNEMDAERILKQFLDSENKDSFYNINPIKSLEEIKSGDNLLIVNDVTNNYDFLDYVSWIDRGNIEDNRLHIGNGKIIGLSFNQEKKIIDKTRENHILNYTITENHIQNKLIYKVTFNNK